MKAIFSGKNSRQLWASINRVKKQDKDERPVGFNAFDVWMALYTIGCHCQELESRVRQLEERVRKAEGADPCVPD